MAEALAACQQLSEAERRRLAARFVGADIHGGDLTLLAASLKAWGVAARFRGLIPPPASSEDPSAERATLQTLVAALTGCRPENTGPGTLLQALGQLRPCLPAWPVSDRRYRLGAVCWWQTMMAGRGLHRPERALRSLLGAWDRPPAFVRIKCLAGPQALYFLADLEMERALSLEAWTPWSPERAAALRARLAALSDAAPRTAWRETGAFCLHQTLPPALRAALRELPVGTVVHLQTMDGLGWLPFEIFHDGRGFWGQRFRLWRDLLAREREAPPVPIPTSPGRRAAVLAPAYPAPWRLPHSEAEVETVRAALAGADYRVEVCDRVDRATVQRVSRECAILHFVGHAVYQTDRPEQSHWRLSAGEAVTAADLAQELRAGRTVRLLFANACHSAPDPDAVRLVVPFYGAGGRAFLGACRKIPDAAGAAFAAAFYRRYAVYPDAGAAVQGARLEVPRHYSLVTLAYTLYGRPEIRLDGGSAPGTYVRDTRCGAR
ncbi:MAG: CHAT domain-containing protein [Armatimonadetes bacterium]|nr:CHAT domain-containing protein [Armatimonadota bacterium]